MNPEKPLWMLLCVLFLQSHLSAQDKNKSTVKFGQIAPADFTPHSPAIDSSSDAVVLDDIGSTEFEGNTKGYFTMIFKAHERILLKSRNAFDEATVKVILYTATGGYEEKFEDFEASTFTIENGQVVETKLPKTSIFKEKYNKDYTALKFTLPNIKEGCIIEYKYSIKSPYYNNNIRSWYFQSTNPVLWSEYRVTIPPIFNYMTIRQGYLPYVIDTAWNTFKNYMIVDAGDADSHSQTYSLSGDAKSAWWAMKDVPAFKKEKFVSSAKNYIAGIKFQLHSIKYSETHIERKIKDWYSTVEDLLKDPDFGQSLSESNSWFHDDLKTATKGTEGLEKAKKIFEYVRDNFTCTDDDDRELSTTLKKTFQAKKGNVADINILLTAMLQDQGYDVHPVLLSTRDNGKPSEANAVLNQYNYVIARVKIDSTFYLLDASVNRLGFGKLPEKCYNGSGRLIDKMPYLVPLSADSLAEVKNTMLLVINDEKEGVSGALTSNLGYLESLAVRDKLAKTQKEDFIKEIAKEYPAEVEVSNITIDSLKAYEEPVLIKDDVKFKFDDDIVYFNPIITGGMKSNPFASAARLYPVEMPGKMNETYTMNMEIPKGYAIDELPKSVRMNFNENEGMFEYIIVKDNNDIQFRCRLILNKANFQPEDYQTLRDFFTYVVKKEDEQIVFKKIK